MVALDGRRWTADGRVYVPEKPYTMLLYYMGNMGVPTFAGIHGFVDVGVLRERRHGGPPTADNKPERLSTTGRLYTDT